MGTEDKIAGDIKKGRGKANDVIGALTDNPGRQVKGKLQKLAGKVQSALGRKRPARRARRP